MRKNSMAARRSSFFSNGCRQRWGKESLTTMRSNPPVNNADTFVVYSILFARR